MKQLLLILLLLPVLCFGQGPQFNPLGGAGTINEMNVRNGGFRANRMFYPPVGFQPWSNYDTAGAFWYDPIVKKLFYHNGLQRVELSAATSSGVTSITASAPLTGGTITTSGTIGIQQASSIQSGFLSSTDWNTFNNKLSTSQNIMNTDLSANSDYTQSFNGFGQTWQGMGFFNVEDQHGHQMLDLNQAIEGQSCLSNSETKVCVNSNDSSVTFTADSVISNAPLMMRGNQIKNVADPTAGKDAVNVDFYNANLPASTTLTAGTGISVGTGPNYTVTNTAPDQTVTLNNGTGISISGTYPTFTITNTSPSSGGTVTSVSGTAGRISSTGGTTPVLDLVTVNATPATYGGSSAIPVIAVDAYGRATSITTVSPATAGTVTTVSVVSANGFAGTVANGGTTPAITLTTTVNAPVVAGNGTALIAGTTTGTGSTVALSASPALTGTPTAPTPSASDSSTKISTTAYVDASTQVITTTNFTTSYTVNSTDKRNITLTISAQAGALLFNNPTGTLRNWQMIGFSITDNGTNRAITFDTKFVGMNGASLPTTTTTGRPLYFGAVYNSFADKWYVETW